MKKVWICGIIMVICIVAAVLLRGPMDNADIDYTEVKVQVVSSETKETDIKVGNSRSTMTTYDIVVSYQGQNYDLKNAHDSYSYRKGATVTAYLSNGKMYANGGRSNFHACGYGIFCGAYRFFCHVFYNHMPVG